MKDIVLLKGLITGSIDETYEDRALMPKDDHFVLVEDLIVSATIIGLYRFVAQPERCEHSSCGFGGKKNEKGHYIKPKCTYVSFRRLTNAELSKPDMSSLFIALYISFLDGMTLDKQLAIYDTANEKFVDHWFQDGGNERFVIEPGHKHGASKVLSHKTNYSDLIEKMKSCAL